MNAKKGRKFIFFIVCCICLSHKNKHVNVAAQIALVNYRLLYWIIFNQ